MHVDAGHVKFNDLLDWCKGQEKEFKHLSRIDRHVLCVPATSASSERNFSAVRLIVQERRTSLNSEIVDSILFLHNMQ
jgi:hypothetical protein